MMANRLARYERMLKQLDQTGRRRVLMQQAGIDFTSNAAKPLAVTSFKPSFRGVTSLLAAG